MTTPEEILEREAALITEVQKKVDEALDRALPVAIERAEQRAQKGKPYVGRAPMRLGYRISSRLTWAGRDGQTIEKLASEKLAALGSPAKVDFIAQLGWTSDVIVIYLTKNPYLGD